MYEAKKIMERKTLFKAEMDKGSWQGNRYLMAYYYPTDKVNFCVQLKTFAPDYRSEDFVEISVAQNVDR